MKSRIYNGQKLQKHRQQLQITSNTCKKLNPTNLKLGLVTLYDFWPGNWVGIFLQPRRLAKDVWSQDQDKRRCSKIREGEKWNRWVQKLPCTLYEISQGATVDACVDYMHIPLRRHPAWVELVEPLYLIQHIIGYFGYEMIHVKNTHTRPQPMHPGRRCHFVVPWLAGPPLNPHLLTTPWKPRSILQIYTELPTWSTYMAEYPEQQQYIRDHTQLHLLSSQRR